MPQLQPKRCQKISIKLTQNRQGKTSNIFNAKTKVKLVPGLSFWPQSNRKHSKTRTPPVYVQAVKKQFLLVLIQKDIHTSNAVINV